VRSEKAVLEGRGVLRREVHVGQAAETSRHPVDDQAFFEGRHDDLPGGVDLLQHIVVQLGGGTSGDLDYVPDP
jgi:hypothetical protein